MKANMAELDSMMFSMDVKLKNKHFPIEKTSFQHENIWWIQGYSFNVLKMGNIYIF